MDFSLCYSLFYLSEILDKFLSRVIYMKSRFYKKHVIDGVPKMEELKHEFAKDFWKNLLYTLLAFVLCVAVALLCGVFISPFTAYFFVPSISCIFARQFYFRYIDFKSMRLLARDYNNYSVWMQTQLSKDIPKKEEKLREAIDAYKQYAPDINNNIFAIQEYLQDTIKAKTDNQILVSLLSGLLFISGDKAYRDTIFKAKYQSGSAGSMVLGVWILYLDGDSPADITFEQLKTEFTDFWNKQAAVKNKR